MREYFTRERVGAVAAAVALGLGVTACGSSGKSSREADQPSSGTSRLDSSEVAVSAQYFSNGTRELHLNTSGEAHAYNNIFEFCDGNDMVEETIRDFYGSAGETSAISRSVDYPGCTDGKLTPADFQPQLAAK